MVVPVTGQDGSVLHLQVSTLLPGKPQPRYKYINPSVPPPGYQDRESWSSQVEDFLARPRASKRKVEEDISPGVGRVKRTPVLPPSPSYRQENKLYRGDVLVRNNSLKTSVYHLIIGRIGEASLASSAAETSPGRSSSTARTSCPGGRE